MITHEWKRDNGGEIFTDPPTQLKLERALDLLVNAELKWGTQVMELTPEKVSVLTRVMGCEDRTTWTGPAKEMEVLFNLTSTYAAVRHITMENANTREALVQHVMDFSKGLPLYIEHASGLLMGGKWAHAALLAMLHREKGFKLDPDVSFDDAFTAFKMIYVENYSVDAVSSLLDMETCNESPVATNTA